MGPERGRPAREAGTGIPVGVYHAGGTDSPIYLDADYLWQTPAEREAAKRFVADSAPASASAQRQATASGS